MYESFYGLTTDPFRLSPDHRFTFVHRSYAKAKAYMQYALHRAEGFVMVTGAPGTGKTTLVEDLLSGVGKQIVARLVCTQLGADDLLRSVAYSYGLRIEGMDKATVLRRLYEFLCQRASGERRALLVVDEAQSLAANALEELRLLTNLQFEAQPLIQVFLLGQEELREIISTPGMEQLRQRLVCACHVEPLEPAAIQPYVEHRLRTAGWRENPSISDGVYTLMYQGTRGVPRRINLACGRLLLHGSLEQKHALDVEDMQVVLEELGHERLVALDDLSMSDLSLRTPAEAAPSPTQGESSEPTARAPMPEVRAVGDERISKPSAQGKRLGRTPCASPAEPRSHSLATDHSGIDPGGMEESHEATENQEEVTKQVWHGRLGRQAQTRALAGETMISASSASNELPDFPGRRQVQGEGVASRGHADFSVGPSNEGSAASDAKASVDDFEVSAHRRPSRYWKTIGLLLVTSALTGAVLFYVGTPGGETASPGREDTDLIASAIEKLAVPFRKALSEDTSALGDHERAEVREPPAVGPAAGDPGRIATERPKSGPSNDEDQNNEAVVALPAAPSLGKPIEAGEDTTPPGSSVVSARADAKPSRREGSPSPPGQDWPVGGAHAGAGMQKALSPVSRETKVEHNARARRSEPQGSPDVEGADEALQARTWPSGGAGVLGSNTLEDREDGRASLDAAAGYESSSRNFGYESVSPRPDDTDGSARVTQLPLDSTFASTRGLVPAHSEAPARSDTAGGPQNGMRGGPASLVNLPSSEYALRGNVQAEREGAVPEVLPAGTAGDTDGSGLSRSRKAKGSDPAEADRSVREALRKHSLEFVSTEKGTFRLELREAGVFAFDSVEVQSELRSKLVKLADVLRTQEGARVRIEGYTDGDGDPVYNTMLAKRRAEAVGLYLRKIGVAARQVQVEGRGEWAAAFPERAQDKSLQRRIEIYLVLAHPG